jgi:hypothetical protein
MATTPKPQDISRAAEPPSGEDEELNHLLHKADMAKTEPIKAFCGTELVPWSGRFAENDRPRRDDCVVCFEMWDSGVR